jgi:hypothetical protein
MTRSLQLVLVLAFAAQGGCDAKKLDAIGMPGGDGQDLSVGVGGNGGDGGSRDMAKPVVHDMARPRDLAMGPLRPCKRGIATNAPPGAVFASGPSKPGIHWWYNWGTGPNGATPGIEFVPMLWGSGAVNTPIPGGSDYVLTFNEPNFKNQSNLTPQQAAGLWPSVEARANATGAAIVSPAVNFCGSASDPSNCSDPSITDPYTWLKKFFAACPNCRIDYIGIHWYNCDLPSLKAYIEGNTGSGGTLEGFTQFHKPLWVTELSCGGEFSAAQQKAYMQAAVPYLDGNPNVYRYSWFSAGPIPSARLSNDDGTLTDLGFTYVSMSAPNCL